RRGAEYDERTLAARTHNGDVAAVIARRLFLFVRAVVFLVDDDEPETIERRKDCRPRADDDIDLSPADAMPLVVTLTIGERAVLNGDAVAERAAEERRNRRCQGNLRDHQQDLTSGAAHAI